MRKNSTNLTKTKCFLYKGSDVFYTYILLTVNLRINVTEETLWCTPAFHFRLRLLKPFQFEHHHSRCLPESFAHWLWFWLSLIFRFIKDPFVYLCPLWGGRNGAQVCQVMWCVGVDGFASTWCHNFYMLTETHLRLLLWHCKVKSDWLDGKCSPPPPHRPEGGQGL